MGGCGKAQAGCTMCTRIRTVWDRFPSIVLAFTNRRALADVRAGASVIRVMGAAAERCARTLVQSR